MSSQEDPDFKRLSLEQLLQLHLSLEVSTCPWTIQKSNVHGQGLFAARRIEEGEVIFRDVALVLGPRSGPSRDAVCVACLRTSGPLRPCSKNCRLPVCSEQCEDFPLHAAECDFLRQYTNDDQETDGSGPVSCNGRDLLDNEVGPTDQVVRIGSVKDGCGGNGNGEKGHTGSSDQCLQIKSVKNGCDVNGNYETAHLKKSLDEGNPQTGSQNAPADKSKETSLDVLTSQQTNTEIHNNVVKCCGQSTAGEQVVDGTDSSGSKVGIAKEPQPNILSKCLNGRGSGSLAGAKSRTILKSVNLELVRSVTPLRCLQMSKLRRTIMESLESIEHPICEVDILKRNLSQRLPMDTERYLRHCCGVLDTNAYGGTGHGNRLDFRGLYALSAIMNHSCTPNTTYWFDSQNQMVVKAASPIGSGDEILSTYTSLLWGTATRRSFLDSTKSFLCSCSRCKDVNEYGTNLSGIKCKARPCSGILLPLNPLDVKTDWTCSSGVRQHRIGAQKAFQVLNICSKVAEMLIQCEDVEQVKTFFRSVPENAQSAVQIRKHFVLHAKAPITETSDEQLEFKEESCVKLLDLIAKLKLGGNYLRGLILQQLYFVLEEKGRRSPATAQVKDGQRLEALKAEYEMILSS